MKNKTNWLLLGAGMFLLAGCAHKAVQISSVAPASGAPEVRRDPASSGVFTIFENADAQLLKDLFHFDTHGKRLKYSVKARLWTDIDKKFMKESVRTALDQAVAKTLGPDESGVPLGARLKKNLMSEFLKQFVYGLQVVKIFDGTVQLDLFFLPDSDSALDLSNELSSNRLVRLDDLGKLNGKMKKLDEWSVTSHLGEQAPRLVELNRGLLGSQPDYIYSGGVISVYLKLLDMHWNPLKPIPNPKKNAVKGFVRYRRYFVHDGKLPSGVACDTAKLKLSKLEWVASKKASHQLVTVDLYKDFDLKGFVPKVSRWEYFPGRWLAANKGSADLLPKGSSYVGKTLKSGVLAISGESRMHSGKAFEGQINSLVYDFEKNRFDAAMSSVSGEVAYPGGGAASAGFPVLNEMYSLSEALLKDCEGGLAERLKLERVAAHMSLGGVK